LSVNEVQRVLEKKGDSIGERVLDRRQHFLPTQEISRVELERLKSDCIPGLLAGKRVVFVMREEEKKRCDHTIVFRDMDVSDPSGIIGYSHFFHSACETNLDILIITNSDELDRKGMLPLLIDALERFRSSNPKSAVIIDSVGFPPSEELISLMDLGLINAVVESQAYSGPSMLMGLGAEILGLLRE
jgi:hypothetical protein